MRRAAARPFAANADDSVMGAAVRRTKTNAFAAFSEAHTANTNDFVMNAAARLFFEVRAKNMSDSGVNAIARGAHANAFPLPEACAANASAIGATARRPNAARPFFEVRAENRSDSGVNAIARGADADVFPLSEARTANASAIGASARRPNAARPSFEVRADNRSDSGVNAIAREADADVFPLSEACAANASSIGATARRPNANALSLFEARAEKKDGCIMGAAGQEGIW